MGFDCAAEVGFSCLSCVRGGADRNNRGISPAVWRQKDLTTSPGWTCSNANGAVCTFAGAINGVVTQIKGVPTEPLANFLSSCGQASC